MKPTRLKPAICPPITPILAITMRGNRRNSEKNPKLVVSLRWRESLLTKYRRPTKWWLNTTMTQLTLTESLHHMLMSLVIMPISCPH